MPAISATIISYNEEQKIEACLQSLLPVVNEIIVVDSFSSDATCEIARRYTDKVVLHPFDGYIEQKNYALSLASYDWVLSLDCDERLSPELQASILALKERLDQHDAYQMARKTFYVYRWLNHSWYPDRKIRLFNRRTAHWGGVNPHDRIEVKGERIYRLAGDIHHYSFDSISAHIQTLDKFSDIGARELIARNQRVTLLSPLSHGLWTFIRLYLLKRGFLDGFAGLIVAVLSFSHVFAKYSKVVVWQKQQQRLP
ncbi:glycosyltransferase family 2 protein [Ectothiorhodospiraceae bacterium BW-2]|nr:glycosyltransferase family 2 protein [Ectothiorhodospiraceae bacterium BW-2]